MEIEPNRKQVLQALIKQVLPQLTAYHELDANVIKNIIDTPGILKKGKWRDLIITCKALNFNQNEIDGALSTAFILNDDMAEEWERGSTPKLWKRIQVKPKEQAKPTNRQEDRPFVIPMRIRFIPKT